MRRFCNEMGKHLFIWSVLVFAFFPLYVTFAISVKNNISTTVYSKVSTI